MNRRTQIYLDGQWVSPAGDEVVPVINPFTEGLLGHVPMGSVSDVDAAVASARRALRPWAALAPTVRGAYLSALAAELTRRADVIADTVSLEMGAPRRIARKLHTDLPIHVMLDFAKLAESYEFRRQIGNSVVSLDPVGVVAAITPWNYPLHQVVAKLAPALVAGCTVVLKPSELSSLTTYLLIDAIHEVGLPPGVVNLVSGLGAEVGAALASHPGVDAVSFTGSSTAGRSVAAAAAVNLTKVTLELGGKSANVILDDADLGLAVKVGVANAFLNSGQTCTAWTRMLVHESRLDEAVDLAASIVKAQVLGDPRSDETRLGPLVSAAQRQRVRGYIDGASAAGGRIAAGGADAPAGLPQGWFVSPTLITNVSATSAIAQEEVFGPVLVVLPFVDDDDALEIANNSDYGLHGAVWSGDVERATAFAAAMDTGTVDINGGRYNHLAPFAGRKGSGLGAEMGQWGLEAFLQTKSVQL